LCCQVLSGTLGCCSFSQHLRRVLRFRTLSPSISHSCRRWKHIKIQNGEHTNHINYCHHCNYCCFTFNSIILIIAFQIGWNLSIVGLYLARLQETNYLCHESILRKLPVLPVCDTRTIPHCMSNVIPGLREHQATVCRVQATDAGCGNIVVCQLVGIEMIPHYVMKANWVEGTEGHGVQHGEVVLLYQLFRFE
jgi:hypothetical protein